KSGTFSLGESDIRLEAVGGKDTEGNPILKFGEEGVFGVNPKSKRISLDCRIQSKGTVDALSETTLNTYKQVSEQIRVGSHAEDIFADALLTHVNNATNR